MEFLPLIIIIVISSILDSYVKNKKNRIKTNEKKEIDSIMERKEKRQNHIITKKEDIEFNKQELNNNDLSKKVKNMMMESINFIDKDFKQKINKKKIKEETNLKKPFVLNPKNNINYIKYFRVNDRELEKSGYIIKDKSNNLFRDISNKSKTEEDILRGLIFKEIMSEPKAKTRKRK